jgi:hypothetical protein
MIIKIQVFSTHKKEKHFNIIEENMYNTQIL